MSVSAGDLSVYVHTVVFKYIVQENGIGVFKSNTWIEKTKEEGFWDFKKIYFNNWIKLKLNLTREELCPYTPNYHRIFHYTTINKYLL